MSFLNRALSEDEIKQLSEFDMGLLFSQACHQANNKLIKYLLISPDLKIRPHLKEGSDWFGKLCKHGNVEMMDFILNEQKVLEINQSIMDNGFLRACGAKRIELVKYFLTSEKVLIKPNIHINDDYALVVSTVVGSLELVRFLLESPDLKEHCNVHARNEEVFKSVYRSKNKDILEYLIFDYKIDLSDEIKNCIEIISNPPCELKLRDFAKVIENQFNIRKLNYSLQETMETNLNNNQKKIKL